VSTSQAQLAVAEARRLLELQRYGILDTKEDARFDGLTALAAHVAGTPMALITLVDAERQWPKSSVGMGAAPGARNLAFCSHVVANGAAVVVHDALDDARFAEHPLVVAGPQLRFYAGFPLTVDDGLVLGALCVLDTVPREPSAEQLRCLQLLAEQTVALLRHHRASIELQRHVSAAEDASRAKSDFLAHMSHEIRTPMTAIMGMSELLLRSALPAKERKYAETVLSASEQLLGLVDDVLDVAKLQAGRVELVPAPFTFAAVVRSVEGAMLARTADSPVKLECRIADSAQRLLVGDAARLRQVLYNLVDNAFKFTTRGKVSVSIFHLGEDDYQIEISDTGVGIRQERLSDIFDTFTQADSSTSRRHGGTGLGLTICKALVELMGGRIWAESAPNHGSIFRFTARLPPAPEELAPPPEPHADVALGVAATAAVRILVVEDVRTNRELVAALLEGFPWQIDFAEDGARAVECCLQHDYDFVLMDVQMPGMDGYEATARIREHEWTYGRPRRPIVAFTAHASDGAAARSLQAGCDGHITKPIHRAALLDAIFKHVAKARPEQAAVEASAPQPAPLPATVQALIPRFLEAARGRIDEVQTALTREDFETVRKQAHALRGSGGAFGFDAITELSARLEAAAEVRDSKLAELELLALRRVIASAGAS